MVELAEPRLASLVMIGRTFPTFSQRAKGKASMMVGMAGRAMGCWSREQGSDGRRLR
jgi:hypothetical protein